MPNEHTSGTKIGVLILHRVRDSAISPRFGHEALKVCGGIPTVSRILHDVAEPLPQWLAKLDFDAVLLDSSMLGYRWAPKPMFERVREEVAVFAGRRALKIALPMDEFNRSSILDEWLTQLNVDLVYTTSFEYRHLLLPKCCARSEVSAGWTSVIDPELATLNGRRLAERPIDVGYRVKRLPYNMGRLGQLKAAIGDRFAAHLAGSELVTDIAVGDGYRINGDAWIRFLHNCKYILGSPSGSSVHDPVGEIDRRVREFLHANPDATFEAVERDCFPGLDGQQVFSVLSPRILEAAMAGCCQVLVRGDYGGLLEADEHYIPVEQDFSNLDHVLDRLADHELSKTMADRCRERLLAEPSLRAEVRDRQFYEWICERRRPPESDRSWDQIRAALQRYGGTTTAALRRRQAIDRASFYFHRLQGRLPAPFGAALLRVHRLFQAMRGL
jgi:hypothetical protein